jgi:hypothetical protein
LRSPFIVIPARGQIHVFNLEARGGTRLRNVRFVWNLRDGREEYLQVRDAAGWRAPDAAERARILETLTRCLMMDIDELQGEGYALVDRLPEDWDEHEAGGPGEMPQP